MMRTEKEIERRIRALEAGIEALTAGRVYAGISGEQYYRLYGALSALKWVAKMILWPTLLTVPAACSENIEEKRA